MQQKYNSFGVNPKIFLYRKFVENKVYNILKKNVCKKIIRRRNWKKCSLMFTPFFFSFNIQHVSEILEEQCEKIMLSNYAGLAILNFKYNLIKKFLNLFFSSKNCAKIFDISFIWVKFEGKNILYLYFYFYFNISEIYFPGLLQL